MPRFSMLFLVVVATVAFGACTVHHHHPDQAGAYDQSGYGQQPAYASQGAPGQSAPVNPYARYQNDYAQRPGAPYVAPAPPPRVERPCTCDHSHDNIPTAVAPRRALPRGPVTPSDLESNPADWLE